MDLISNLNLDLAPKFGKTCTKMQFWPQNWPLRVMLEKLHRWVDIGL